MPERFRLYDTDGLTQINLADDDFIKEMIALFIKNIPETIKGLQVTTEKKDWAEVYFYAHKLKASIDLFDLNKLRDVVRSVEVKAKHKKDVETIAEEVDYISAYINECIEEMKEEFELA